MPDSATSVRERRKIETRKALTLVARRLTAERGLNGFTVDELCDEVGVARRTFFNYFQGKEDAVLGVAPEPDPVAVAEFLETAGRVELLDALVRLVITELGSGHLTREEGVTLVAAMEREPRLLQRMLKHQWEREDASAVLIEQREGWPPGDLRARTATQLLNSFIHAAMGRFMAQEDDSTVEDHILASYAAARQLFAATLENQEPLA